ncbi:glycosyltransferase family 4 protein [Cohnella soli]|uniref:Glycosyltransferase family 4 protein n=1 Tax=Cohnella soli TaxID=425005 RepID=A0ABW0I3W8_9BACL
MPGKVLFCATVDYHFRAFHLPTLRKFKEAGWDVHIAARGQLELPYVDRKFDIPFSRSPFSLDNVSAYRQVKALMDKHEYNLVHCHTPMGGVVARLAARNIRRSGAKVLYTAHGFHFYKGAPLQNWLLYYPIEKWLARHTDCLITINDEDFALAAERKLRAGQLAHVHGIGIDASRFKPLEPAEKSALRRQLGYRDDELLLFYAAEFNVNKNHRVLIEAMAMLKDRAPAAKMLFAGKGGLEQECRKLAEQLGVASRIDFLGYRDDIPRIVPACDIVVSGSLREGLPVNIMEAMACGLPVVASRNRGHNELVEHNVSGFLLDPLDAAGFAARLEELASSERLRFQMKKENLRRIDRYTLHRVQAELTDIYMPYAPELQIEAERSRWAAP